MKTTLNLDDDLLKRAKRQAAAEGRTLTAFFEDALRARLLPKLGGKTAFRLKLPVDEGSAPPAVDVADRDALYDFMDRSS